MIVGIDPDIKKSGIATLTKEHGLQMKTLAFVHVMEFIRLHKDEIKCVYIEAGWFNKKSSWHGADNKSVAARIGKNVGMNHAAGMLLDESIRHEGVKTVLVKPSAAKYDAVTFNRLTKYKGRTNQEERDAAALLMGIMLDGNY